jgi:hypothetical protein
VPNDTVTRDTLPRVSGKIHAFVYLPVRMYYRYLDNNIIMIWNIRTTSRQGRPTGPSKTAAAHPATDLLRCAVLLRPDEQKRGKLTGH